MRIQPAPTIIILITTPANTTTSSLWIRSIRQVLLEAIFALFVEVTVLFACFHMISNFSLTESIRIGTEYGQW
jgi:hypothetical protein